MGVDIILSLASLVVPIIALFIGAYLQKQRDRVKTEQEVFFIKKRELYLSVIEPIMRMISNANNKQISEKASAEILTIEYKKSCLEFTLFGNDATVKAFNNLFQVVFDQNSFQNDPEILLPFLGKLNLEMRKELGNKSTRFDEFNMLEYIIKDIKSVKKNKRQAYLRKAKYIKNS